jgi:hypothetical protein
MKINLVDIETTTIKILIALAYFLSDTINILSSSFSFQKACSNKKPVLLSKLCSLSGHQERTIYYSTIFILT